MKGYGFRYDKEVAGSGESSKIISFPKVQSNWGTPRMQQTLSQPLLGIDNLSPNGNKLENASSSVRFNPITYKYRILHGKHAVSSRRLETVRYQKINNIIWGYSPGKAIGAKGKPKQTGFYQTQPIKAVTSKPIEVRIFKNNVMIQRRMSEAKRRINYKDLIIKSFK